MSILSPLKPYTDTIKLIAAVLIGCLFLWAGQKIMSWRDAAQVNEQRGAKIEATTGIVNDSAKADENRATVDTDIATARDTFTRDTTEARRHEPATADRATRPVPDSLRRAYRARRLARQRSGCIGDECGEGPETEAPPKR